MAALANFGVLWDTSSRIVDYVIFSMPRTVEGSWDLLEKLHLVKSIPHGARIIFALSVAIAITLAKIDNKNIPKNYTRFLDLVYGKNL
jgi:hypothetical protein